MAKQEANLLPWKCPKCGAKANEHGKGGYDACKDRSVGMRTGCQGFLCECDSDGTKTHGRLYSEQCENAVCYHCGWAGTFPGKPPSKWPAWAKTAAKAGWTPPVGWQP